MCVCVQYLQTVCLFLHREDVIQYTSKFTRLIYYTMKKDKKTVGIGMNRLEDCFIFLNF